MSLLSFILFLIFSFLGGIHFYWLLGGEWGVGAVIPTKEDSSVAMSIPKFATFFVAVILVFFGLIYLTKSGLTEIQLPYFIMMYGCWFIPIVFIIRAIGEFKYVGFFKKIKNTKFSKADSKYFSPLCLFIGILGILIQIMDL